MIFKYEVIDPPTNYKKPHLNKDGALIIPNIIKNYSYYVEASLINNNIIGREYYLLLSATKFDECCRKCRVDTWGRLRLNLHGDLLAYVKSEIKRRGNVNVDYLETEDNYDVYKIT